MKKLFLLVAVMATLAVTACATASPSATPLTAPTKTASSAPCPAGWRPAVSGMALTPLSDKVQVWFSWDKDQVAFTMGPEQDDQDVEPVILGKEEKIFLSSENRPVGPQPIWYIVNADLTACVNP